jgi:hypothetical protein
MCCVKRGDITVVSQMVHATAMKSWTRCGRILMGGFGYGALTKEGPITCLECMNNLLKGKSPFSYSKMYRVPEDLCIWRREGAP